MPHPKGKDEKKKKRKPSSRERRIDRAVKAGKRHSGATGELAVKP